MKTMKVGGVRYKIKFVSDPRVMGPKDCSQGWCWGLTDYRAKEVTIYKDPSKDEQRVTFYHELGHCILDGYHLKNMRTECGDHDEDAVDLLGVALAEALGSLGVDILDFIKDGAKK
jgi:hypothetical protein